MFVIVINGKRMHREGCRHGRLGRLVLFRTLNLVQLYAAGMNSAGVGYVPCKWCKPLHSEGWPI